MLDITTIRDRIHRDYELSADRLDLLEGENKEASLYEQGRFEALGDFLAMLDDEAPISIDSRL